MKKLPPQNDEKELEHYTIDLEHKRAVWATGFNGLISLAYGSYIAVDVFNTINLNVIQEPAK